MSSNLPPGVSEGDLPGNRPGDVWHDEVLEGIGEHLVEHEPSLMPLGSKNVAYIIGKFLDTLSGVVDASFKAGYEEGRLETGEGSES